MVAEEKPDLHCFVCDALGIKYEVNFDERNDPNKFRMKQIEAPELWHPCSDIDVGSTYTTHQLKRGEN